MSNIKTSQLPTQTTIALTDKLMFVKTPGSDPKTSLITLSDIITALALSGLTYGNATLGVDGSVTVANTSVTTANRVVLFRQVGVSNQAIIVSAVVAGVSFTITSAGGADDSGLNIGWMII